LFSAIVDFVKLEGGRVDILGEGPFEAFRFKGRIGVLPQDAQLDPRLTPHAFLRGMGQLQGLSRSESVAAAEAALRSVNMAERGAEKVGALSHGMRRRISVASALLGHPELVLLDEPTAGLDPREAASLRSLLKGLGGATSVVVSSHNLAELEQICDHVVLIEAGRCLGEGTVEELTARGGVEVWSLGPGHVDLAAISNALPGHSIELVDQTLVHKAATETALDAGSIVIAGQLSRAGVAIRGVRRGHTLEDSYLERTQSTGSPQDGSS